MAEICNFLTQGLETCRGDLRDCWRMRWPPHAYRIGPRNSPSDLARLRRFNRPKWTDLVLNARFQACANTPGIRHELSLAWRTTCGQWWVKSTSTDIRAFGVEADDMRLREAAGLGSSARSRCPESASDDYCATLLCTVKGDGSLDRSRAYQSAMSRTGKPTRDTRNRPELIKAGISAAGR